MRIPLLLAVPVLFALGCDRPEPTIPPDPTVVGPAVTTPAIPDDPVSTTDGVHPVDQRPTEGDTTVLEAQRDRPRPATQCEGKTGDELAECLRAGRQEPPQESRTPLEEIPRNDPY